ncbi:MAG: ABC transporter permease, partial [Gaiellaceae bacterium]
MRRRAGRAPLPLVVAAGFVIALLLLPLAYLVVRVAGSGRALEILGESSTWRLVWNTVLLAVGVVLASVLVAVPLAWLVTRTDLPARRLWATAGALPLVIPSYVAAFCLLGFLGERGLLADALRLERLPELKGYGGSLIALTLATYPYVFLLTQNAFRSLDPSLDEAARGLGISSRRTFLRVTAPALRPAVGLGALLVALYTFSDFGVVSLMDYDTLTRSIYVQYRS